MPINPSGSFSVPLELFGGVNKDVSPIDLPEGLSPSCQDVAFLPGSTFTRPALTRLYAQSNPPSTPINFIGTFSRFNGNPLTVMMDGAGNLYFEDVNAAPGTIFTNKFGTVSPGQLIKADNGNNRYWMAFSDGLKGIDIPRYLDANGNFNRISQSGPAGTLTPAQNATAGSITAGIHKVCVSFRLASGYITKPSPIASWTSLGTDSVQIPNIPTGGVFAISGSQTGDTVVGRILHFTGAGGSDFYYIAKPVANGGTMILDNTTTTVTLTFSDAALFGGVPIGVKGNNLFALDTLGPCVGLKFYKNRLVAWGELTKVTNLLNMDFDGGVSNAGGGIFNPLGWSVDAAGGGTCVVSPYWQGAWKITGNGLASPLVGRIFQSCYQDSFGVPIVSPSTLYSGRCWAKASIANLSGTVNFKISSMSTGFSSIGSISASQISTSGGWVNANLPTVMPAVIPTDMILELYGSNINIGATITIDEAMLYPTAQPVLINQLSISYLNNPESFDLVTGLVSAEFPEQEVLDCWEERDVLYFAKSDLNTETGSLHATEDNGSTEPSGWSVRQISKAIGLISARGSDLGEDYSFLADISGLYMFNGGEPLKCSQEIQSIWDSLNPAAYQTLWMKNDRVTRRLYIGIATGTSSSPNQIAVMDYREMKGFSEIAYGDPVHISYAGRVLSTDLSRKWTTWNIPANCGAIIQRANNQKQFVFGGAGGTGFSSGGFHNAYSLDIAHHPILTPGAPSWNAHDDDYGQINSFYITYFLMTPQVHQAAQMLGLNLYDYLRMKVGGVGTLQITLFGNDLSNEWPLPPTFPLPSIAVQDAELGLNVVTERMAVGFQPFPTNPGVSLDAAFVLQKLVASGKKHAWAPVRGVF